MLLQRITLSRLGCKFTCADAVPFYLSIEIDRLGKPYLALSQPRPNGTFNASVGSTAILGEQPHIFLVPDEAGNLRGG